MEINGAIPSETSLVAFLFRLGVIGAARRDEVVSDFRLTTVVAVRSPYRSSESVGHSSIRSGGVLRGSYRESRCWVTWKAQKWREEHGARGA